MKAPLAQVRERFGSKQKLIEAVRELASGDLWVDRLNENKGLALVSNTKLLHLHDVLSRVKKEMGSRTKLVDAILETEKRVGDAGYKDRLEREPTPELWEKYRAARRRGGPPRSRPAKRS